MNDQLTPILSNNLNFIDTITNLSTNLAVVKPNSSEATQLITYSCIAIAITGIIVYHYFKNAENATK